MSEQLDATGPANTANEIEAGWRSPPTAPLSHDVQLVDPAQGCDVTAMPAPVGVTVSSNGNRERPDPSEPTVASILDDEQRRARDGNVRANVYHDAERHTVTLLLDEAHATAVIYAVRALADDYEAHAREARAVAATLPPGTYGAKNRAYIAIRHERIASRLRRVESRYRMEVADGGLAPD